jgi:hypothetical protein
MMKTISDWRNVAKKLGIGAAEIDSKARAFRMAGSTP